MKKLLCAMAAVSALLASPSAFAQAYAGLGIGPSRISIDCAGTLTCDRTDTGFKLYGGWNFPGPLALEGVYFDWGKANSTSAPAGGTSALDTKARGLGVGAAYFVRFGWGECVARLGIARNRAKTTTTLNGVATSDTLNNTAPYWGAGCAYPFAPTWWVTAEADFSRVKYIPTDKATTQLITLGLRHSF